MKNFHYTYLYWGGGAYLNATTGGCAATLERRRSGSQGNYPFVAPGNHLHMSTCWKSYILSLSLSLSLPMNAPLKSAFTAAWS